MHEITTENAERAEETPIDSAAGLRSRPACAAGSDANASHVIRCWLAFASESDRARRASDAAESRRSVSRCLSGLPSCALSILHGLLFFMSFVFSWLTTPRAPPTADCARRRRS